MPGGRLSPVTDRRGAETTGPFPQGCVRRDSLISRVEASDERLGFLHKRPVAHENRDPLVKRAGLHIQNALRPGAGRAAGMFGQKRHGRAFVDQPQLAGGLLRVFAICRIIIDAAGEKIAVKIGHQ